MKKEKTLEQYILELENKKESQNKETTRLKNDFYGFSITPEINDSPVDPKMY